MTKLNRIILTACAAIAAIVPAGALAQVDVNGITAIPQQFKTFDNTIKAAFNLTIIVSGVIFVALILYGGVLYLTSVGDEDVVGKARRIIINGAVGLVIVLTSFAIGTYVLQLLGIGRSGTLNTGTTTSGGNVSLP